MKTKIYALGEVHNQPNSVRQVEEKLRELKPDLILHELAYSGAVNNAEEATKLLYELEAGKFNIHWRKGLNDDILRLVQDIDVKVIGIDRAVYPRSAPLHERMIIREKGMVDQIDKALDENKTKVCVIVVGDTHLRNKSYGELEMSPLTAYLKGLEAKVIRAPKVIREMQ